MRAGPGPSGSPVLASRVASPPWLCVACGLVAPVRSAFTVGGGGVSALCPSVSCKNPRDWEQAPPNPA